MSALEIVKAEMHLLLIVGGREDRAINKYSHHLGVGIGNLNEASEVLGVATEGTLLRKASCNTWCEIHPRCCLDLNKRDSLKRGFKFRLTNEASELSSFRASIYGGVSLQLGSSCEVISLAVWQSHPCPCLWLPVPAFQTLELRCHF